MSKYRQDIESDSDVQIASVKPKLSKPPLYKVIILNDDYTPMEFVVKILKIFFRMDTPKATRLMLKIHSTGAGICGIFSREIAEMRVKRVNDYSRSEQHPLLCIMELAE